MAGDSSLGRAKYRLLVGGVLLLEEQAARHGDYRRRNALLLENVTRLDREMQFRAGAQDSELALPALRLQQDIAALGRPVLVAGFATEQGHRLAGKGHESRLTGHVQNRLPAFGGLDRIAGAIDREVRDGPQRRELLDRLMRGAVFAEADRVMRHDEDRPDLHKGREADGRPAVIREAQESAAVRDQAAVQRDAVHGSGHAVLAHAVVHVGAIVFAGPDLDHALRPRVVRGRQVGGASQQFRDRGGEMVEHGAAGRTGRHFAPIAALCLSPAVSTMDRRERHSWPRSSRTRSLHYTLSKMAKHTVSNFSSERADSTSSTATTMN